MKKQLLPLSVLGCGLILAIGVKAQTCGLKPVELPPLLLPHPVQKCSCGTGVSDCRWVWVSSDQDQPTGLDPRIFNSIANYNPSRYSAETKQEEEKARLLHQQNELLRQQTEALRLGNQNRRRQASSAEIPQSALDSADGWLKLSKEQRDVRTKNLADVQGWISGINDLANRDRDAAGALYQRGILDKRKLVPDLNLPDQYTPDAGYLVSGELASELKLSEQTRNIAQANEQDASTALKRAGAPGAQQQETLEKFKERVMEARRKYPDFDVVTSRQDVPLTPAMMQAIVESDAGGELVYYFGQHPEEGARIAKLSPVSSVREIGKIEGRLIPAN